MKIEDVKKANKIVEEIFNINNLLENHSLKNVSDSIDFEENKRDLYGSGLFKIKEAKVSESTGGGYVDLPRIKITEFGDGSGAKYNLSKQETIALHNFIENMLKNRKRNLENELDKM